MYQMFLYHQWKMFVLHQQGQGVLHVYDGDGDGDRGGIYIENQYDRVIESMCAISDVSQLQTATPFPIMFQMR